MAFLLRAGIRRQGWPRTARTAQAVLKWRGHQLVRHRHLPCHRHIVLERCEEASWDDNALARLLFIPSLRLRSGCSHVPTHSRPTLTPRCLCFVALNCQTVQWWLCSLTECLNNTGQPSLAHNLSQHSHSLQSHINSKALSAGHSAINMCVHKQPLSI